MFGQDRKSQKTQFSAHATISPNFCSPTSNIYILSQMNLAQRLALAFAVLAVIVSADVNQDGGEGKLLLQDNI